MSLIPSTDETPDAPTLGETPVIPGSDIAETTRMRTIAPPDLGQGTLSKIAAAMQVIGASFGDVERKTGAGNKTIEFLKQMRDDETSRSSMGYITRLHDFAMRNPSRAKDAMQDLTDFLGKNAGNVPLPIQTVAGKALDDMQTVSQRELARQVVMGIGPEGGPQIMAAGRMMRAYPNADPQFIINLSKEWPAKSSTILGPHPVTGEYFKVTQQPDSNVTMTKMSIDGFTPIGKGAEQYDKLDEWTRRAITSHLSDPGAIPPHALMMKAMAGEPEALKQLAGYEAEGRTMKAAEGRTEAEARSGETLTREKAVLDYKQTQLTEKQVSDLQEAGVYKGQQKVAQVLDGDWETVRKYKASLESGKVIRDSLANMKTVALDDNLNRLPVGTPEQVDAAMTAVGAGTAYRVTQVQAEKIGVMAEMSETVRRYNAIVQMILADRDALPGTTLGQYLKLVVAGKIGRGTITGEDAAFMQDMQGELGLRISKALTNTARSNYMGQQASKMLAGANDTIQLAAKKTAFLRGQFSDAISFELGKPNFSNWRLSSAEVIAAIPELKGQIWDEINPGTGKSAVFGDNAVTTKNGYKINWGPMSGPSRKPPQER